MREFVEEMFNAGLQPPTPIDPGRFYRFPGVGKPRCNRAGWCFLFPDRKGGIFGCWATGLASTWHACHQPCGANDRVAFRQQIANAKNQAQHAQNTIWKQAAARAERIWHKSHPANPIHHYLKVKNIPPYCARQIGPRLVLPITGWDGELTSLQFIAKDSTKRMLKGGRKRARFIRINGRHDASEIVIAEGFATAATLAQMRPNALTLASIDAGNLKPVAIQARKRLPRSKIIIAADADQTGLTKGRAAAIACGGLLAVPVFPPGEQGSDWNDLAALEGVGS